MINNFSNHALAYLGAAIFLGSFSLIGAALLGYGLQAELAKWMSGGAAAMVVGGVLVGAPAVFLAIRYAGAKKRNPPAANEAKSQMAGQIAGSSVASTVSALARTVFIGLAARRPMAMLGLAALVGALISTKSDSEKNSASDHGSSDHWRKRAPAAT